MNKIFGIGEDGDNHPDERSPREAMVLLHVNPENPVLLLQNHNRSGSRHVLLGSNTSLNPSPTKFSASKVPLKNATGNSSIHG